MYGYRPTSSPGDDDMDTLFGGSTYGASTLTFDFTVEPNVDEIELKFSLTSFDTKSGLFAVFLNGVNIAWIPGTSDLPVNSNTVNDVTNEDYYYGAMGGGEMQYMTKQITASGPVKKEGTNTLKLTLAGITGMTTGYWFAWFGANSLKSVNRVPIAKCKAPFSIPTKTTFDIDDGSNDPEDGTSISKEQSATSYDTPGIYETELVVYDSVGASNICYADVVVYDPIGGFATGK